MLNVYMLRHGETRWNAEGNRYCGRTDLPLTERGEAQARAVRQQLKGLTFDAVYASPLVRSVRTAQVAGGGAPVEVDDRLIETDFGAWEGKSKEEFIAEDPVLWQRWMEDPEHVRAGGTGETAGEVIARVSGFYEDAQRRHPSGNILVVGHNGVNRFYLCWRLGMPVKHYRRFFLDNAAPTWFALEGDSFLFKSMNGLPGLYAR